MFRVQWYGDDRKARPGRENVRLVTQRSLDRDLVSILRSPDGHGLRHSPYRHRGRERPLMCRPVERGRGAGRPAQLAVGTRLVAAIVRQRGMRGVVQV